MVAESISARIYPDEDSCFAKPTATERLDIRIPVGNDVLHVYRISVGQDDPLGEQVAEVMFCAYDRIPGGIVSQWLADGSFWKIPGENKRFRAAAGATGGWSIGASRYRCRKKIPV